MAARPPLQMSGGSSPYLGGAAVGPEFQVAPPPQYMTPRPGMMVSKVLAYVLQSRSICYCALSLQMMPPGSGRPGIGLPHSSAIRMGGASHHHHHHTRSSSSSADSVRKRLAEAAKAKAAQSKP